MQSLKNSGVGEDNCAVTSARRRCESRTHGRVIKTEKEVRKKKGFLIRPPPSPAPYIPALQLHMSNRDHLPERAASAEKHRKGPWRFQLSIYLLIYHRQAKQPAVSTGPDGGERSFFNRISRSPQFGVAVWRRRRSDWSPPSIKSVHTTQEVPPTYAQSRLGELDFNDFNDQM